MKNRILRLASPWAWLVEGNTFPGLQSCPGGVTFRDNTWTGEHAENGTTLRKNGEIVAPVQNFRWNMSPLVGYSNITAVGKPVPIHTGESYDGPGTALVPPVRTEDFYMTSVSPAV